MRRTRERCVPGLTEPVTRPPPPTAVSQKRINYLKAFLSPRRRASRYSDALTRVFQPAPRHSAEGAPEVRPLITTKAFIHLVTRNAPDSYHKSQSGIDGY